MQVFEPRRFVELRKKDFVTQALSAESFGMGIFYTVNVFWIQFYLGGALLAYLQCSNRWRGCCWGA
jgi:hypothetical protein